jgi:hypothetical protein
MEQGKAREEEMVGARGEYLKNEANKKVGASQAAMESPVEKVSAAAEQSNKVSTSLDKVKNFFSREGKKKQPDIPKNEIGEQLNETEENKNESKRFGVILEESSNAFLEFSGSK